MERINRRVALKWIFTAAGGVLLSDEFLQAAAAEPGGVGYGTDPDLTRIYKPGELWPLTLNAEQRKTAAALCDCIIPADEVSPSASAVGVTEFIDEWVSAPYPKQREDRKLVLAGLEWIDDEAKRRFGVTFAAASISQQTEICRDICYEPKARADHQSAARFFTRYRDLTAGGFYTTPEGTKDIGYVGNVPQTSFEGPPPELIRKLGLD